MDIRIKEDGWELIVRVVGLVINGDKFLIVKNDNNEHYCLPGGHLEFGEDTLSGLKREIKEEMNSNVIIENLFAVVENFFLRRGCRVHEFGYYFTVVPEKDLPTEDFVLKEIDKGVERSHGFKWVNFKEKYKQTFALQLSKTLL